MEQQAFPPLDPMNINELRESPSGLRTKVVRIVPRRHRYGAVRSAGAQARGISDHICPFWRILPACAPASGPLPQ